MAQSLIPFPSTTHPIVPISRQWIAFSVLHKAGGPSWAVVDASTYELHPEASAYLHYLLGSAPGPKRGQQPAADNGAQMGRTVRGAGSSNWHHNKISSEPSPYYPPVA